jgi:ABC-type glycerol-3-phosphate transport system substrate-binding protein
MISLARAMSITILLMLGLATFSHGASLQQPVFGKSLEELEKMAAKEGKLRMISNLFPEEVPQVLKGFYAKYPAVKVEFTRGSGVGYSERILSEALAGLVEYDLIDIANELYPKYLKAGVLAGPFEWRRLFPAITEAQVSSDGNFVGVAYSLRVFVYNPSLVPAERVPKIGPIVSIPIGKENWLSILVPIRLQRYRSSGASRRRWNTRNDCAITNRFGKGDSRRVWFR